MPYSNLYGIAGKSEKLASVIRLMEAVAPTDTRVLIMGESGTGKERIAECVHELSPRAGHPLIKVNCAALPADLVESILFGHERGAFTGAGERRTGKFELANNGTIFLDEIGTLPPEAQAKLLRVLQENEIERIGGHTTIRLNTRIIAATNSDLRTEVTKGNFRADLYYRLQSFPIILPPLRERREDVPILVHHFLNEYSNKMKRPLLGITQQTMSELYNYDWPGNVRELKHVIERSVVLNEQPRPDTGQNSLPNSSAKLQRFKTIDEVERDHIIMVLVSCNGKICGENGAAQALQIAASTLQSKIKRLRIKKITPLSIP